MVNGQVPMISFATIKNGFAVSRVGSLPNVDSETAWVTTFSNLTDFCRAHHLSYTLEKRELIISVPDGRRREVGDYLYAQISDFTVKFPGVLFFCASVLAVPEHNSKN